MKLSKFTVTNERQQISQELEGRDLFFILPLLLLAPYHSRVAWKLNLIND